MDFISKEMRLEYSDVETLIDEYRKEPSSPTPVQTTQVIAVNESKPPDVRKDLLDNLIKVRFARERKLLYGEVVDINLLKVRIQTPDDSLVTIPCKTVLEDAVADANSGELNCQVVTEMYLPGNSNVPEIKRIAYAP